MKNNVHKKVEGKWLVEKVGDNGVEFLKVEKLNNQLEKTSLIYHIYDNMEDGEYFNSNWYGKSKDRFTREELMSVHWPTYLTTGEKETITVLPSGNFYVE